MSKEEKDSYSRDFKAKVVLEATSGEQVDPAGVARKYEVSPEQILAWADELNISDANLKKLAVAEGHEPGHSGGDVELSSSSERFAASVEYGATHDILDMKKLSFWTLFGTGFVVLIIFALMGTYKLTTVQTIQQVYEQGGSHYEVNQLREHDRERLSGFGVVNAEEEIYHVPIEQVISRMARDAEQD